MTAMTIFLSGGYV